VPQQSSVRRRQNWLHRRWSCQVSTYSVTRGERRGNCYPNACINHQTFMTLLPRWACILSVIRDCRRRVLGTIADECSKAK
jgi:hypothetical protein